MDRAHGKGTRQYCRNNYYQHLQKMEDHLICKQVWQYDPRGNKRLDRQTKRRSGPITSRKGPIRTQTVRLMMLLSATQIICGRISEWWVGKSVEGSGRGLMLRYYPSYSWWCTWDWRDMKHARKQ
jgi:hypothetical protein